MGVSQAQQNAPERVPRLPHLTRLRAIGFVLALLVAGAVEGCELGGLRVCADPANLPFSSKDLTNPGFEVELARALAPDATFHWVPTYRWPVVARQLLDRRCDLFFGLPIDQRFVDDNPRIALSRPYYVMGQVLVSRAGEGVRRLEDLRGRVVGVHAMTSGDLLVAEKGHPRRVYLTPEETFAAVRTQQVDAAVMDSTPAGWLAKQAPGVEITWLQEPAGEFKVAVGMRRDDRALREAVDRALHRLLKEGRIEDILARYGVTLPPRRVGAGTR
ncbi:MAG: substrate-binding periplasmic protein [Candidatus Methylomirabilales bacterium]